MTIANEPCAAAAGSTVSVALPAEAMRGYLVPLSVSNVVYSVHMYLPHAFTHQGVHGPGPAYRYPGTVEGKAWDKAQLEAALKPVIDFQRTYGVHIYIGEFSAIRWAPEGSAVRYLSDLIDIFEAQGSAVLSQRFS